MCDYQRQFESLELLVCVLLEEYSPLSYHSDSSVMDLQPYHCQVKLTLWPKPLVDLLDKWKILPGWSKY